MSKVQWLAVLGVAGLMVMSAQAQTSRPYVGFVYPAGGQQGTTFRVKLGGQAMDGITRGVSEENRPARHAVVGPATGGVEEDERQGRLEEVLVVLLVVVNG
jgi:hypothetical protein